MLGQTVIALKDPRIGAICLAGGGCLLVGFGAAASLLPVMGIGVIVAAMGVGWWLAPQTKFSATFLDSGIQLDSHNQFLNYREIVAVCGMPAVKKAGPGEHYPIDVCTAQTGQTWPARLSVPSKVVEDFLASKVSPVVMLPKDDDLTKFFQEQAGQFGPQAVVICPARVKAKPMQRPWGFWGALSGLIIGSIGVIVWGSSLRKEPLMMTGITFLMTGSMIMLLIYFFVSSRGSLKLKRRELTCMVVSPFGFGLRQGDLKGILRWDELLDFTLRKTTGFTQSSSRSSTARVLTLKLDGTTIPLLDVYDRSLEQVELLMRHYWLEAQQFKEFRR